MENVSEGEKSEFSKIINSLKFQCSFSLTKCDSGLLLDDFAKNKNKLCI